MYTEISGLNIIAFSLVLVFSHVFMSMVGTDLYTMGGELFDRCAGEPQPRQHRGDQHTEKYPRPSYF